MTRTAHHHAIATLSTPPPQPQPSADSALLDVGDVRIHHVTHDGDADRAPIVFLHEGLGSVELWRGFPAAVAELTGRSSVVYSRPGNGWSSPLTGPREPDYMHRAALDLLPRVVDELVGRPPVLVGHSDGASIALVYAGAGHPVAALVLIAPHVFVEPETIASIAAITSSFPTGDLPVRMARYHRDPEGTFFGWADVWLSEGFRPWNIEEYLPAITCPTLLIQGDADEYGTVGQLEAIEESIGGPVERVVVPGAGHSPHLSHPDDVTSAVVDFLGRQG